MNQRQPVLKSTRNALLLMLMGSVCFLSACATKSRSKTDQGYPDYNRLEIRPKRKDAPTPVATPMSPEPKVPVSHPSLNSPMNLPSGIDDVPAPPPAFVPLKSGSEPELPDDMLSTLVPGTTGQK